MAAAGAFLLGLACSIAGEHSAEIVLEVADKLGGCAVGDCDPRHAGNEVVATSGKGAVLVAHRSGAGWEHEIVLHAPGEMIQVAAGDALPARAGDEIVVVGMARGACVSSLRPRARAAARGRP